MDKFLKIFSIFLLIIIACGTIFFALRFVETKNRAEILAARSDVLAREKEDLLQQKLEEEKLIVLLKKELAGLAEIKNIKEKYDVTEKRLKTLDESYLKIEQERNTLQQSNLSLNSRVTSLTREFTQTLENLKMVKQELSAAKSDKTILAYLAKIEKNSELLKEKDGEIKKLVQKNSDSNKEKKVLEKKIGKMESDQKKLENKLEQAVKLSDQSPSDKLKSQIAELHNQLKDKEEQRSLLNKEVVRYANARTKINEKLNQQSERIASLEQELLDIQRKARNIKKIEAERDQVEAELAKAEQKLTEQEKMISALKKDQSPSPELTVLSEIPLKSGKTDADLNRAYVLYDTAKAQVVKFSELLMSKEVELETSKQRINELEKTIQKGTSLSLPEGATEARQYVLLKDRIKMLNDSLSYKEEALRRKDEELAALAMAKKTLEERGLYQDKEFKDANMLYANLKNQMLQTSELLARREEEIFNKNQDILSLKNELAILQAEFKRKQQELVDMQERQRITMDDLTRSTQLNITLQENMVDQFKNQPNNSEDKLKADRLKKEIELLMGN
ncbi:MAG: hypothetical protein KJ915_08305 [Candidatus Omnitrophica bacterium]|nr:hypothetical protein [Candidatus Omnitrophota bacterium]